ERVIAGERDHRALRARTIRAEPRRERPAEMAGAAHVALPRTGEVEHPTHPHAGMAGVHHDDAVVRYMPRELRADALRPDRQRIGAQDGSIFLRPFLAD